jgi:hypothetical protein
LGVVVGVATPPTSSSDSLLTAVEETAEAVLAFTQRIL